MVVLGGLLELILLVVFFECGKCDDDEVSYAVGFSEGFSDCEGFTNKIFLGENMKLGKSSENGEDTAYLSGYFEFRDEMDEGSMIDLKISKESELGNEPMWSCSADLCKSIKDEKAPWTPALQTMGITDCPVKTGEYPCENLTLDMNFMKDMLTEEYVGFYDVEMTVMDSQQNKIACHHMGLSISEVEKDDD